MKLGEDFRIRDADWAIPRERNLVRSSWLKSHGKSAFARLAGRRAYYSGEHELIDWLLDRTEVRVACSPRDRATIIGWACMEPARNVVHYVWVQEDFRREGVARALLESEGFAGRDHAEYTHRTDALQGLPLPPGWWFNIFNLMGYKR